MAIFKNHILVPIDFSEQSLIALGQSVNFARITKASITLIYVLEDPFHLPFMTPKTDKSLEKNIRKELEKISSDTYLKHAVKTDFIIVHGKVYEEIVCRAFRTHFVFRHAKRRGAANNRYDLGPRR